MPFKKDKTQSKLIEVLNNIYNDVASGVIDDAVIKAQLKSIIKREQEKESVKICPLALSTLVKFCLCERCAWWMGDDRVCAITSLAWSQDVIAGYAKESE